MFDRVAHCIQTSVSDSCDLEIVVIVMDGCLCNNAVLLFEVALIHSKYRFCIDVVIFKYTINQIRRKLFMRFVGYVFDKISDFFPHFFRKADAETLLQDIVYTAFSGLAVDTDNVGIVSSSHILRIDRKIGNAPCIQIMLFSPGHSLCNRILMGTGECGEHKLPCIRLSGRYFHSCHPLVYFTDVTHICEVKFRIHPLGEHIHGKCDNIHISGTLSVAEKGTFNAIRPCKNAKLCIADAGTAVIVRMQGKNHILSVAQMFIKIFYLACKYMRHCVFHSSRQIDDRLIIFCRLPYIKNCITHFKSVIDFCSLETFWAVLKCKVAGCFIGQLL